MLTPAGVIRLVWSRMKDSVTSDISVFNPLLRTARVFAFGLGADGRVTSKLCVRRPEEICFQGPSEKGGRTPPIFSLACDWVWFQLKRPSAVNKHT